MSNLPGNPYLQLIKEKGEGTITTEAVATLALAYEQRTATLLQLAIHQDRAGKIGGAYFEQVASRLGLDGDDS